MLRTAFLTALAFGAAAVAYASVTLRASVEDLAENAQCVADVTVLDHTTSLDRAAGAVFTSYRVRVGATLVGGLATEMSVRVRGGRVGTMVQEVLGSPDLRDGERVVLFLGPVEAGARSVVGMAQGAFHVETDAATGAAVCRNSLEGLSLIDAAGAAKAEPLRMPLSELTKRVAAGRDRLEARRQAAREARDRRLAAWRRDAERREPYLRGRPGGPSN